MTYLDSATMFFSNRATSICLKLFIFVSLLSLINGNPITRKQFSKVNTLIETKILEKFPSDDSDKFSDLLYQEQYEKGNLTYYHAGDKKLPVFISFGTGKVGSNVHVLQRGEDYVNPHDRNTFIVLKKSGKDNLYNVHRAYVLNMDNIDKSNVLWGDIMVEQKASAKPLLEQMGNKEVQARSMRASRPFCDWIGLTLICNSKKNIPPVRERIPYELDVEEYEDAPKPLGGASGSAEGEVETKVVRKREKPYKVPTKARAMPPAPKPPMENEHVVNDEETKKVAVAQEVHAEIPQEDIHEKVVTTTSPLPEEAHNEETPPQPEVTPDEEQKRKRKHKKKHRNKKNKNNM